MALLWAYGQRFCCEQLFRDQKSGIFQLESSGLRDPQRIDRLLLVVAIAKAFLAWAPIPLRDLEPCIPSRGVLRRQKEPWSTRIDLRPRAHPSQLLAVA